ncbi:MAG: putative toxin-antitoxin system toxin component, PIN family [Anaerolineae bacterium]
MTMRVLLDTNIVISYLLSPNRAIARIVEEAILGSFNLLLPEDLLDELTKSVSIKRYLVNRITPEELRELVEILAQVSETIPRITMEIPAVTRDPKDDYLLAYALVGQADYLVTGDKDLLALAQIEGIRIVTAREFAEVLSGSVQP